MEVVISAFWLVGIIVLAVIVGYFIGRQERTMMNNEAGGAEAENGQPVEEHKKNMRKIVRGKIIASPVDGKVHYFREGGQVGAMIEPAQGKVYAPLSGKIVKLYPMGNAFLLQGDDGMGVLIRVGRQAPDELCSMYFRARIVQNEIVNKGKLLLEFDRERLTAAGEEVNVTVCADCGMTQEEVAVTEKEVIKVGEELLRIC